jgi:hypothetical protein
MVAAHHSHGLRAKTTYRLLPIFFPYAFHNLVLICCQVAILNYQSVSAEHPCILDLNITLQNNISKNNL